MNTVVKPSALVLTVTVLFLVGCARQSKVKKEEKEQFEHIGSVYYKVEAVPQWSDLFKRNSGWFGGDGIFTIPLNGVDRGTAEGDTIMFLFSDTLIGKIIDGELQDYTMVHNSIAYLTGPQPKPENMDFVWAKKPDSSPATMFVPQTDVAQPKDYYWLGDGFVNQALGKTYIFAYRIRNTGGEGTFPFKVVGNPLIVLENPDNPPFKNQRQIQTLFFKSGSGPAGFGSFGAGIFVNTEAVGAPNPDGYIYVYGVKGKDKQLIAARVKPKNFENFEMWNYWDGDGWNPDISVVQAITNRVSNELSVTPIGNGKYALIFTVNGVGPKIGMRIGESPVGPFSPIEVIWKSDANETDPSFFSYNAKAHPAISPPGELLVSFNVNSFKFFKKINKFPHLYRPRFIRVIFKQE